MLASVEAHKILTVGRETIATAVAIIVVWWWEGEVQHPCGEGVPAKRKLVEAAGVVHFTCFLGHEPDAAGRHRCFYEKGAAGTN